MLDNYCAIGYNNQCKTKEGQRMGVTSVYSIYYIRGKILFSSPSYDKCCNSDDAKASLNVGKEHLGYIRKLCKKTI